MEAQNHQKYSNVKINNPHIDIQEKLIFLKQYITPYATMTPDVKSNVMKLDIILPEIKSSDDYLLNCLGTYLRTGRVVLNKSKQFVPDSETQSRYLKTLQNMIESMNVRFNLYVQANDRLKDKLSNVMQLGKQRFEDFFNNTIDEVLSDDVGSKTNTLMSNVSVDNYDHLPYQTIFDGVHPKWSVRIWQTDFLNACRQRFLWGNAFDTGLGKTSTSVLAVQDRQNRFPHERALFTVPSSTLGKWYKEAFIGSYKNGELLKPPVLLSYLCDKAIVIGLMTSADYKRLMKLSFAEVINLYKGDYLIQHIYNNPEKFSYLKYDIDEQLLHSNSKADDGSFLYNKVFMSHEHFYRLKLTEKTVENFINHQIETDDSLKQMATGGRETFFEILDEYRHALFEDSYDRNRKNLYLEDMDISILVIDEGHAFKNNMKLNGGTGKQVSYHGVRYLPSGVKSRRGFDMVAKTYYIRSKSSTNEGILCLTATPITNSPIEIYSMLSLMIGADVVNMTLNINGILGFLDLFSVVEDKFEYGIDDTLQRMFVFRGLNNLKVLTEMLHKVIYFVDDSDDRVQGSIKLPEAKEQFHTMNLSSYQKNLIQDMKETYRICREVMKCTEDGVEKFDLDGENGWDVDKINNILGVGNKELSSDEENQANILCTPKHVALMKRFGEYIPVASSPFNLINKFETLVLDEDLLESATLIYFTPFLKTALETAIQKFNKKNYKYQFTRLRPNSTPKDILKTVVKTKVLKSGDEKKWNLYHVHANATMFDLSSTSLPDSISLYTRENTANHGSKFGLKPINFSQDCAVLLNTTKFDEQSSFVTLLAESCLQEIKNGNHIVLSWFQDVWQDVLLTNEKQPYPQNLLLLVANDIPSIQAIELCLWREMKFNLSNKIVTALEQITNEFNYPRGKNYDGELSKLVKQVAFCDFLGIHFKLKALIHQISGVALNKIAILTGDVNGENDEVLKLQDDFNAEDGENKVQMVIANKKGETGIDLQNGTQAITHFTIGWTPDNEIQRNGRPIRQGNQTDYVNIHHVMMNSTFDEYKRNVVNVKSDWINQLFNGEIDYFFITQQISQEQQEEMIMLMGDENPESIIEHQRLAKQREEERLCESVKFKQEVLLDFMLNSIDNHVGDSNIFIENQFKTLKSLIEQRNEQYHDLSLSLSDILKNKKNPLPTEIVDKVMLVYKDLNFSNIWSIDNPYLSSDKKVNHLDILDRMIACKGLKNRHNQMLNGVVMLNQTIINFINEIICPMITKPNGKLNFNISEITHLSDFKFKFECGLEKALSAIVSYTSFKSSVRVINLLRSFVYIPKDEAKPDWLITIEQTEQVRNKLGSSARDSYLHLCKNEPNRLSYSPNLALFENQVGKIKGEYISPNSIILEIELESYESYFQTIRKILDYNGKGALFSVVSEYNQIKKQMSIPVLSNSYLPNFILNGLNELPESLQILADKALAIVWFNTLVRAKLLKVTPDHQNKVYSQGNLLFSNYLDGSLYQNLNSNVEKNLIGGGNSLNFLIDIMADSKATLNSIGLKKNDNLEKLRLNVDNELKERSEFVSYIEYLMKTVGRFHCLNVFWKQDIDFKVFDNIIHPNEYALLRKTMALIEFAYLVGVFVEQNHKSISSLLKSMSCQDYSNLFLRNGLWECQLLEDKEIFTGFDTLIEYMQEYLEKQIDKISENKVELIDTSIIENQQIANIIKDLPSQSQQELLKRLLRLDELPVDTPMVFYSSQSYKISQDLSFRDLSKKSTDHAVFFYYNGIEKVRDYDKSNVKKMGLIIPDDMRSFTKVWVMTKGLVMDIIVEMRKYYSNDEFVNLMQGLQLHKLSPLARIFQQSLFV